MPWLANANWEDFPHFFCPRLYHGLQALGQLIGFHRVLALPAAAPVGGLGPVVHSLFCRTHRGQFLCQQSSGPLSTATHTGMTWVSVSSKWHREKATKTLTVKRHLLRVTILSDDTALSHYTSKITKPSSLLLINF